MVDDFSEIIGLFGFGYRTINHRTRRTHCTMDFQSVVQLTMQQPYAHPDFSAERRKPSGDDASGNGKY
jgi:hypothetical protein